MYDNRISIELGLEALMVLGVAEAEGVIEVCVRYAQEEASCPRCQASTAQVHQWSRQAKRDGKLLNKKLWLHLWKRRFRCPACRHVFTEDDPSCGRRRRTTQRFRRELAETAQDATVRAVSRRYGVSEGLVQRSWLEAFTPAAAESASPALVGLDAFCVRRPGVMWSGLWDLQTRRPLAFQPGQRQRDIEKLLREHLDPQVVEAVAMDLWRPNRRAVETVLPRTAIVADKFHVVALGNQALHASRRRGQRLRPGTLPWLMHRNLEDLWPLEQEQLSQDLEQDQHLRTAWMLKEGLRSVYKSAGLEQATRRLDFWLRDARQSSLEPFQRLARTLSAWREQILNYWRYPLTNALVEGKHNRVKVLKRRAYGYRNDHTFLLRLLNLFHT